MTQFLQYSGIALWVLILLAILLRLIFGKNWLLRSSSRAFFGLGLVRSVEELSAQLPDKVQKETVGKVVGHLLARLTRIGVFALLLAGIPIWLLWQQNKLLQLQNFKFDIQNERINIQNSLTEAQRRNSLILLMNSVLDQVNEEVQAQKQNPNHIDSLGYSLSDLLIGRIAALSQGFLPYRNLEGDTLSERPLSIERGQLLLALVNSRLDTATMARIYSSVNFTRSNLSSTNLIAPNLKGAELGGSDLSQARIYFADFREANLRNVNLSSAFLYESDFSRTQMHGANLSQVIMLDPVDLYSDQLYHADNLHQIIGLDSGMVSYLKMEKPCLFTKEGCK